MKHARYYWLFPAEGHLNRRRFGAMLSRIALLLPVPTGQADAGQVRIGIGLQRIELGQGECCKSKAEHEAISAVLVRIADQSVHFR